MGQARDGAESGQVSQVLVQGAVRQHPVRVGDALILFLKPHTTGPVTGAVQLSPGIIQIALVVKPAHGAEAIPLAGGGQDFELGVLIFRGFMKGRIVEQCGRVGQGIDFFLPLPKEAAEEIW